MTDPAQSWPEQWLAGRQAIGRTRATRPLAPLSSVEAVLDGRRVTLFSSNDYLGLAADPAVRRAAAESAVRHGMGMRGSPLVCGYSDEHAALEADIAELKQTETALLFASGYAANLAAVSSLGAEETEIFSDALNHASLIDGCRLARAQVRVFDHCDVDHLESVVKASRARRKVIVTDSLFSMDGDRAPLADIVEVKRRYGCILILDEAHATLVLGPRGGGLAQELGVSADVDLQVGTLSKACGTLGGFVATSHTWRAWLLNRGRSYVFSTALPVPIVAAARAAIARAAAGDLRQALFARMSQLGVALGMPIETPIIPLVLGEDAPTVAASNALLSQGLHIPAIRPPSVPEGTSRLRLTLSAAHARAQVDRLAAALGDLGLARAPGGRLLPPAERAP